MADYLLFMEANAPWFVALFLAALLGAQLERTLGRLPPRRRWRTPRDVRRPSAPFDAAEQLRCVERASFSARSVLNTGEARLFAAVERACAAETPGWRVLAQVSLGEILCSPDEQAYRAVNSKRTDLLLVDARHRPLHAIELQGSGHHLGPAATRDAIKKEALRRAGIGYVEVMSGDTPAEVQRLIARLVRRQDAVPPAPMVADSGARHRLRPSRETFAQLLQLGRNHR